MNEYKLTETEKLTVMVLATERERVADRLRRVEAAIDEQRKRIARAAGLPEAAVFEQRGDEIYLVVNSEVAEEG